VWEVMSVIPREGPPPRGLDPGWLTALKAQPKYRERSGDGDDLDEKGVRVIYGHVVVNRVAGAVVVRSYFGRHPDRSARPFPASPAD
jgi:hypothetical protein